MSDPSFPGGALELGMRIEQRRVGPLNPPEHSGTNYEVQTGADPLTTRAWWNFQHSIAYNGIINDLDALTFTIRTDVGTINPTLPAFDMLALRTSPSPGIDDRNDALGTATFSDLYQTSQNPVFGWFSPGYNLLSTALGAWNLTLAALEAGRISSVSICAHTAGAACDPAPLVYTCSAFQAPMDQAFIVKKKANRVLPLKMVCSGNGGTLVGSADIAAPIVQVTKSIPSGEETIPDNTYLSAGQGTDGNEFVFDGSTWRFNLQTKNFTGAGTYTITAVSSGGDVLVGAPTATFVVQ